MGYLAFVGVTLLGVQDADFFIDTRQTDLPLIGVTIPAEDFFVFAPILGAALYIYLHLHLLKLWEALAAPSDPAPGGVPLADMAMPWLVNDFGLRLRGDGAVPPRPLGWLSFMVTFVLVFLAAPLLLLAVWIRYWPAHAPADTLVIGFAFALTMLVAIRSFITAVRRLRLRKLPPSRWWGLAEATYLAVLYLPVAFLSLTAGAYAPDAALRRAVLLLPQWERRAIDDDPRWYVQLREHNPRLHTALAEASPWRVAWMAPGQPIWITKPFDKLTLFPTDLSEVEAVPQPDDWLDYEVHKRRFRVEWCGREGLAPAACGAPPSVDLDLPAHQIAARTAWCDNDYPTQPACDDHFAKLETRFTNHWRSERRANITLADLTGADLREARMEGRTSAGRNSNL